MRLHFPSCLLFFLLAACNNRVETVEPSKQKNEGIFYDYQVWGEEENEAFVVRLQYKRNAEDEAGILLQDPGRVTVDGVELAPDSTKLSGVFYEVAIPAGMFSNHTVSFTDKSGKQQDEISFGAFRLAKELPARISRNSFKIVLNGLPSSASVRLVMTDTSFLSNGVNEEIMVEDGILHITEQHLANLTKGPVSLEIYREAEKLLGDGKGRKGRLLASYAIKRRFTLAD